MLLSKLFEQIQAAGDVESYALWLAAPDKDGTDVDLAAVGRVEIHWDADETRLYPASTMTDADSVDPEADLGTMLSQLPAEVSADNDLRIVVEVPLLRDESGNDSPSFAELQEIRIGPNSQEVWLLVRPASEFADGLMPE